MPQLPIYYGPSSPPIQLAGFNHVIFPVTGGTWFYGIANPTQQEVDVDLETLLVISEPPGPYEEELKKLNDNLAPYYRFESGTSMAAPAVSGVLALMQEFFEIRLG